MAPTANHFLFKTQNRHTVRLLVLLPAALFCLGLFNGCVKGLIGPLQAQIEIDADLNQNNPVVVDFVAIHDSSLVGTFEGLTAQEWFDQRADYLKDYETKGLISVMRREWTPAQKVEDLEQSFAADTFALAIFAFYSEFGVQKHFLKDTADFNMHLRHKDFMVEAFVPEKVLKSRKRAARIKSRRDTPYQDAVN